MEIPPAPVGTPANESLGRLLVGMQFGLLGLMGWRAFAAPAAPGGAVALLLAASAALALWALTANRPGNFNIRPTPRQGGTLVTHGPYRWVRHPMYTSVLTAAAAAALQARGAVDLGLWLALLAVLLVKANVEERALLRRFPEYGAYRSRTKRFLPILL